MTTNCNRPQAFASPPFVGFTAARRHRWRLALVCTLLSCRFLPAAQTALAQPTDTVSLAGKWRFDLDRADVGISEKWFDRALDKTVSLPGSLPAQGIGDDISLETKWMGGITDPNWFKNPLYAPFTKPGNFKFPFWLQPDKYYAGAAWYQRDFDVPAGWSDRRLVLFLERPHWQTRLWVDGQEIGTKNSLFTPHEYDLGTQITPGKHRLTLRVDNRMIIDVGNNSHSVSDHTQGNWNGIVGRVELQAGDPFWIADLQAFPNLKAQTLRVEGAVGASLFWKGDPTELRFEIEDLGTGETVPLGDRQGEISVHYTYSATNSLFQTELPLRSFTNTWDEFNPRLYRLTAHRVRVRGGGVSDLNSRTTTFGLRELATDGTQFVLNGRKTFIRGTLECCIFPLTGHPPTDVESWKRIIKIAKGYGLNLMRFHSYCPPEAAFIAGDELGFYFQVETCWANQSTTIGDGKPVDQWVYDETARILHAYGNHPSFLLMLYGNEPGGRNANAYLAKYVDHFKKLDPRRLWSSGSGWPQLAENQFHVTPDPRVQSWGGGLKSRINALPPETRTDYRDYINKRSVPVISHEIGQWCVYPNFDEIPKYKGYLKPRNFEIFRANLEARGMGGQARTFLLASGKLQTLCYKEDIEAGLRTPGMGGFELLDLHDFPGQGTALVGVLDPFWGDKGYVTAAEYSRFCNTTVPLARLAKRVFTSDETLVADLEAAHFGPAPLSNVVTTWKLVSDRSRTVASGKLPARDLPLGNGIALGETRIDLKSLPAPARYKLVVGLNATRFENDWDIWVYPPKVDTEAPTGVTVASDLDDATVAILNQGGKVLLLAPPAPLARGRSSQVVLGFSSIFWNTAWTGRQPPTTLGILCNPAHPALAEFPTDDHSNWQWWYLISQARPLILDDLPPAFRPTVQVIDDWVTNHKLGLVFEARVGAGKLLVSSIDLRKDLERNPVARQMLHSLLKYAAGPSFKPAFALTPEQVRNLIAPAKSAQLRKVKAVTADSAQPGFEPQNALDGDAATLWHTAYDEPAAPFPHYLQVELEKPARLRGLTVLPRQDGNPNGSIKDYEVYVSQDGRDWGAPVAKGAFTAKADLKRVDFPSAMTVRLLKLVALSGHARGPWASVAELELQPAD